MLHKKYRAGHGDPDQYGSQYDDRQEQQQGDAAEDDVPEAVEKNVQVVRGENSVTNEKSDAKIGQNISGISATAPPSEMKPV